MPEKLFYVEEITDSAVGVKAPGALLQYIPEKIDSWVRGREDFRNYIRVTPQPVMSEGHYVNRDAAGVCTAGDDDPRAKAITARADRLRAAFAAGNNSSANDVGHAPDTPDGSTGFLTSTSGDSITTAFSYHVNVGHGNHSLIVFTDGGGVHIWMVDCSNFDLTARRYHGDKIKACLDHISRRFGPDTPDHVEAVMLTHPHYDHYSGIRFYMSPELRDPHSAASLGGKHREAATEIPVAIDHRTAFYLNFRYPLRSHNFNNLLEAVRYLGAKVVEPVRENSSKRLGILCPDRSTMDAIASGAQKAPTVNNISSVYNIRLADGINFLFPGDIESRGWQGMKHCCDNVMKQTRFYAVSHHGSLTGHQCGCRCTHHPKAIAGIHQCLRPNVTAVLMGRDGAYSDIFNPAVVTSFPKGLRTDRAPTAPSPNFLEINLLNGNYNYY